MNHDHDLLGPHGRWVLYGAAALLGLGLGAATSSALGPLPAFDGLRAALHGPTARYLSAHQRPARYRHPGAAACTGGTRDAQPPAATGRGAAADGGATG